MSDHGSETSFDSNDDRYWETHFYITGKGDASDYLGQLLGDEGENASGDFATSNVLPDAPMPGLFINHYGIVDLPLKEEDVHALVAHAHQAPFGKGSKTIVDTSVRKTWEINASEIKFCNSAWNGFFSGLLDRVASELGIDGGRNAIKANLYKLLLYEEGSFFDKHQDSEKEHGMFGTLVLALPSLHTGGDVQVTFRGEQKTLRTEPSSYDGFSYLAWFSDVEHEVEEVISGNRLVLTYNLCHIPGVSAFPTAKFTEELPGTLTRFFQDWERAANRAGSEVPAYMAYMLEHKYTDANLRLSHLKGKDRTKAGPLISAMKDGIAVVYLANLERRVWGGADYDCEDTYGYGGRRNFYSDDEDEDDEDVDDYEDDDEDDEGCFDKNGNHRMGDIIEDDIDLRLVVNQDGLVVAKGVRIDESDIVQQDAFGDVPDDEDFEGYTGNEGPDVTHYYRKSAFLVMPKAMEIDFLFHLSRKDNTEINQWLLKRLQEYSTAPSSSASDRITRMCNLVISDPGTMNYSYLGSIENDKSFVLVLGTVLTAACKLNTPALFEKAAFRVKTTLDDGVYAKIGEKLQDDDFQLWKHGIGLCVRNLNKLYEKYDAITKIRESMNKSCRFERNQGAVTTWMKEILSKQMVSAENFEIRDAEALVLLAEESDELYLFRTILDVVKKRLSNRPFVIEFANRIAESSVKKKLRYEVVKNVFHDVLFNIASDFSLDDDETHQRTGGWGLHSHGGPSRAAPSNPLKGAQLATLVNYGFIYKLFEPVIQILEKISKSASHLDMDKLASSVISFLPLLSSALKDNSIPLTTGNDSPVPVDLIKNLYRTALERYFREYVKTRPRQPTNWIRNQVPCSCGDCALLNEFLRNPVQQVGWLAMAKHRRAHLESKLRAHTTCTHVTQQGCNPHKLVVTKNNKDYTKALAAFEARLEKALTAVRKIDFGVLRALLGDGIQHPVQDCRWVRDAMEGRLAPLRESSSNVLAPGAPRVTKAVGPTGRVVEIVDLT